MNSNLHHQHEFFFRVIFFVTRHVLERKFSNIIYYILSQLIFCIAQYDCLEK